jgi:2-C-methyl-D-erythritol 4-phosphate cytidylyltransferase
LQALYDVPENDIILVHDAARPGVSAEIISSVIEAASSFGSALAAIPVVDTLKREDEGKSAQTFPRYDLWRAQTPQAASRVVFLNAYKQAILDDYEGTDEAELLEHIGIHPMLVTGNEKNLKVTYPEDLELLRKLMGG